MISHPPPRPANAVPAGPTVLREAGPLSLLTWPALDASGADAAVTARSGGVSSGPYASLNLSLNVGDDPRCVLENRRRLAASLGASPADFVFAGQVHQAGVRVVGEPDRGRGAFSLEDAIPGTDALVTTSPAVVLAILTADCVPIVLHDPVAGVLACVHAGWRGTAAGVAAAAVAAMQALGSRPPDVIAGIGPAIAPARYQVGPDVYQAVTRAFGSAASAVMRPDSVPGRWRLDLWAANRLALREAGVPDPQIHTTILPTGPTGPITPTHPTGPSSPSDSSTPAGPPSPSSPAVPTHPGHFFSDRSARPCGRLALVARLRAPARAPMDVTASWL
jgi:YfiH family protein